DARLTGVRTAAGIAVAAAGAVDGVGGGADSGARITRADDVALIPCSTNDGIGANADARLTGVRTAAGIAVVAAGAVDGVGVRADSGARITRADDVALIQRSTNNGIGARTDARLTGVRTAAGIAVAAAGAVD